MNLKNYSDRLEELKTISRDKKELVFTTLQQVLKQIRLKKGLKEVQAAFKKEDVNQIVLCIVSTQANPAYLVNPVIELAIEKNIPIFYTDSNQFIPAIYGGKEYKAICGLIYSLKQIPLFASFSVK